MDLLEGLQTFFATVPLGRGERLIVAFSGGGDSTALLWGLSRLARGWGVEIVGAHLDHAMDGGPGGSAARAAQAAGLARRLDVALLSARREVAALRRPGESLEAAARRIRYRFLEEARRDCRARYVATAHHRDDQAETVLLRLRFGSGLRGLAAIRPVAGTVVRPLLAVPRATLRQAVAAAGLVPAEDPGNADLRQPRGRMRHRVLPALARAEAAADGAMPTPWRNLSEVLARLADRTQRALPALDRRLDAALGLPVSSQSPSRSPSHSSSVPPSAIAVDGDRLAALPPPLLPYALALLHARAGAVYPPSRAAAAELLRQLSAAGCAAGPQQIEAPGIEPSQIGPRRIGRRARVGCDCGAGWTWYLDGGRREDAAGDDAAAAFTYTLEVPGERPIPEIAQTIRVSQGPVEAWMLRGAPHRAGFALPLAEGGRLTVRSRRPGDCIRPLGSPGRRKLKDVLIDRGIPKAQRDRLPLLCWAGEIVWVPGVTIEHRYRLTGQATACLAELAAIPAAPGIHTRY